MVFLFGEFFEVSFFGVYLGSVVDREVFYGRDEVLRDELFVGRGRFSSYKFGF